jgi:proton glutamate symport protein
MFGIKLHWWIFGGMILGVLLGVFIHQQHYDRIATEARVNITGVAQPPADVEQQRMRAIQAEEQRLLRTTTNLGSGVSGIATIFLNLLRMIVIPLVFSSLVVGITGLGDPHRLGRLGVRALGWYLMTSFLAIITGLMIVNLLRPGVGLHLVLPAMDERADIVPPETFWDFLISMIPANVAESAAQFDLFGVIFFAILFGIFTLMVGETVRAPVVAFFNGFFQVMMKMTMFVIALAPIGIAALIARLVALSGPEVFLSLIWYLVAVLSALGIHFFITLPLVFFLFTRRNPYRVMRAMSPALLTAFSTASSAGTLPLTIERMENGVGVSNKVASFVLPLGATVNMDGTALYECVAVIFVAQLYATITGYDLTFANQVTIVVLALLVSIGAAGIPHAGLVMMVIIFEAVGLPTAAVALLWAVDRVVDMTRTAVNIWSDSMGAATIAHHEGEIDEAVLFNPPLVEELIARDRQ